MFSASQVGALRAVVPPRQLPAAAAAQTGRQAAVQLSGPPLGGALFAIGRAEAIRATISLAIAPLGPLVAGAMLAATSARMTIALFAGVALLLALWGTLSPSIRAAPSLDELELLARNGSSS